MVNPFKSQNRSPLLRCLSLLGEVYKQSSGSASARVRATSVARRLSRKLACAIGYTMCASSRAWHWESTAPYDFCCCQLKTIISCDEDWFLLIPNLCASVCQESVCLYAVHTLNTALACVVLCSQRLTRTFAVFRFAHKKRKEKKKDRTNCF